MPGVPIGSQRKEVGQVACLGLPPQARGLLTSWCTAGGETSNLEVDHGVLCSWLAVLPLVIAFVLLQRLWESGLMAGAVK
ncbi:hypothetical protein [Streptomyces sp. AHA2]|uniref:hypothetical protein n=1 Tax=Streptomyces sp. AHA2 TaxID=3064526 RepID=UPI003FA76CDC